MDVTKLLQKFENSTHSEKVKRMVEVGRLSTNDNSAKQIIDTLSSRSLYEKALALETCYGSRDVAVAKQALEWPSKHLQERALYLLGLLGTDEEFLAALIKSPKYLQIQTTRRFRDACKKRRRLHVIEIFLEELESTDRDPSLFQRLFSMGSKAIVARNLARLIDHFTLADWSRLAKYHPSITQDALQDRLERYSEEDHHLRDTIIAVILTWLAHDYHTGHAITLFKVAQTKITLERFPVRTLIAKRPEELFRIILDSDEQLTDTVFNRMETKTLRKLPLPLFLEAYQRYDDMIDGFNSPDSFDNLRLDQRIALLPLVNVRWRRQGILKSLSIDKLPTAERIKEARRHITNKKFITEPEVKIKYIAMLPWDEAIVLQEPFLRSSDAEIRGSALKQQIAAAKFDDARLNDALKLAIARKNEQGTVKKKILEGMAEIPASGWKNEHLNDLGTILRNLLDTADTSTGTIYDMSKLVTSILSYHPRWAAAQFAIIVRERKQPRIRNVQLSGKIPLAEVMAIVEQEMSPVLSILRKNKTIDTLKDIASTFGSLIKYWHKFLDVCEEVLEDPEISYQEYAVEALMKYRQQAWKRIVPSILRGTKDTKCGPTVVEYAHERQQNLLWEFLKPEEDKKTIRREALKTLGKKSNGWKTVSKRSHGFWRWTKSQQEAFAEVLISQINDQEMESSDKTANIRYLSALAFVDTKHLISFAGDESQPIVQEAALRALTGLDGRQGVPVLIEALSDQRARTAIYALRASLKNMPKDEAFSILNSVPRAKVTVAKETLRLIGELETEEAYQYLLERSKENLHIDVRSALYKALLSFKDRDEVWAILMRTAEDPEPDIAKTVATIPSDGLPTGAKEHLVEISLGLLNHPDPVVRFAILKRCSKDPLYDPGNLLAKRLFELVHSSIEEEAKAASKAIFITYAASNIDLIRNTYRKLMSNRVMLAFFHDQYDSVSYKFDKKFIPVTHAVLQVLKEDRFSVKRRVDLMFERLYWPEIEPYLFEIIPELHADALVAAEKAITTEGLWALRSWLRSQDSTFDAELKLAQSADERARRLALALLQAGVDEDKGWGKAELERLEVYRQDVSPLVAEAAWDVYVDEEKLDADETEDKIEDEEASR